MTKPARIRDEFLLDPDVVFLNHGSFGACPRDVFARYQEWQLELERQPVAFLGRRLDGLLADARASLGAYVGADPDDIVFAQNATAGVNLAAWALDLQPGDEVLSTNLEYGALDLAWTHVCSHAPAQYIRMPVTVPLRRIGGASRFPGSRRGRSRRQRRASASSRWMSCRTSAFAGSSSASRRV